MQFSLELVRSLARVLEECELSEVSLQSAEDGAATPPARLMLRRAALVAAAPVAAAMAAPLAAGSGVAPSVQNAAGHSAPTAVSSAAETATAGVGATEIAMTAPAVGVFRPASSLQVDDLVRAGQIMGRIESLNVRHDISAPAAGRVVTVLVEDGQGVEYAQPLVILEATPPADSTTIEVFS